MNGWRRLGGSVAATLVVAAPGWLSFAPTAHAAECAGSGGVTVVVDFHQLGGGVETGCDTAEGHTAAQNFTSTGFPLDYVQQTPGFVCRVSGKPASDPCVRTPPATAYWSLWWSDGRSGTWSYSTVGAGSLKVPEGGYVAFSWQGQAGRALPGVSPTPRRTPEPAPAPSSTPSPDKSPKPPKNDPAVVQGEAEGRPEVAPTPTASAPKPEKAEVTPSPEPSEDAATVPGDASPTADASPDATSAQPMAPADEPGRLPGWLSVALILGLAGGATTAWWWRRPTSGGP